MRKKFNVGVDGRIEGLRVIGFHGEVDFAQTPARREPVFADAEGRLVGLEEPERAEDGSSSVKAVWGLIGQRVDARPLLGFSTQLARPHEASWTSLVVVLGETELRHASELVASTREEARGRTSEFFAWLGTKAEAPVHLTAQRLDNGVTWYCSLDEASALYHVISRVAEQHMLRASNQGDDRTLYQSSWWLSRAAMDDSDRYTAAVGLERSNRRMADAYLKATFRQRPPDEIETGLKHARGVFEDRRVDALRKEQGGGSLDAQHAAPMQTRSSSSAGTDRGPFASARSSVRAQSIVRKQAA